MPHRLDGNARIKNHHKYTERKEIIVSLCEN